MQSTAIRIDLFQAPRLWQWSVEQLHALTEAGILPDGEPVELIDGILIRKDRSDRFTCCHGRNGQSEPSHSGAQDMNHGVRHSMGVRRGPRAIEKATRDLPVHVQVQLPITLDVRNEPEPDYCLVRGEPEEYETAHPGASDLLLVVEVADSSLEFDRTTKRELYAASGVVCYWIVNLRADCVEVFEDPADLMGDYQTQLVRGRGESVVVRLPDGSTREIPVDALLCPS